MAGVSSWSSLLVRSVAVDTTRLALRTKQCQEGRVLKNVCFLQQRHPQSRLFSNAVEITTKIAPNITPSHQHSEEKKIKKTAPPQHIPVLLEEVISTWIPPRVEKTLSSSDEGVEKEETDDTIYLVDGTVGGGGHALAALKSSPSIRLLAMDIDESSLDAARYRISNAEGLKEGSSDRVSYWHGSYATIGKALRETPGFPTRVHGILVDLGFGSAQMDNPNRGFSFRKDGPLDMRFDQSPTNTYTARAIVNGWSAKDLEKLFRRNGEPMARVVANAIVRWREWAKGSSTKNVFKSTLELRHVIDTAVEQHINDTQSAKQEEEEEDAKKIAKSKQARRNNPNLIWRPDERRGKFVTHTDRRRILRKFQETKPKHPQVLTRCFQALRTEVNRELYHVHCFFEDVCDHLREEDGRLVVISFHPNEDGMVEYAMKQICSSKNEDDDLDETEFHYGKNSTAVFEFITADPIRPSREEVKLNRRARSARLRAVKSVGNKRND